MCLYSSMAVSCNQVQVAKKLKVNEHKGVIYQWHLHFWAIVPFTLKPTDRLCGKQTLRISV